MIISISGKKQYGKDTVCKIIQYLMFKKAEADYSDITYEEFISWGAKYMQENSGWERRAFADKLKEIVCMLIGCTMEQLEDNVFKETPLGEEWDRYYGFNETFALDATTYYATKEEVADKLDYIVNYNQDHALRNSKYEIRTKRMTPRLLLQLLGTDCGRKMIHPNIWVNALMSDYKEEQLGNLTINPNTWQEHEVMQTGKYPNWVIADMRFPNEAKAVKVREGFNIRVNNSTKTNTDKHESETALDDYTEFDAIIDNNGTIEELIQCVKEVLQTKNLL